MRSEFAAERGPVWLEGIAITTQADLIAAPDQTQDDGRPFIAERLTVSVARGRAYVCVTGRAIRADGNLGTSRRYKFYALANSHWYDPAPAWLVAALRAVGVTW